MSSKRLGVAPSSVARRPILLRVHVCLHGKVAWVKQARVEILAKVLVIKFADLTRNGIARGGCRIAKKRGREEP